jgi:hypothetical protein
MSWWRRSIEWVMALSWPRPSLALAHLVVARASRSRRSLGLAGLVAAAGIACLLAFHPTSHADPGRTTTAVVEIVAPRHVWQPSVITAPGLPLQCADGAWTRTVVHGGCAHHGGVVY